MATRDFKDDGQTENQRLYRLGAKKAPSPEPRDVPASNFASSFLDQNSGALDMMRSMRNPAPAPASGTGSAPKLDAPSVVRLYDGLRTKSFQGTPEEAAELETLIQRLR